MSGKGGGGVSAIPAGARKMVQSLKEIVNCPELEIYAMLKECNMDPNDTVNRLLAQDPFHEVKSKREKKKENKDTSDYRSRNGNHPSNRGGRGGTDRYAGRGGSSQFISSDSGVLHGKPAYKKENGMHAYTGSSSSASGLAGNNVSRRPPTYSDSVTPENKVSIGGICDGISSSSQPSPGFQSAWLGVPGQVSMADIVKMGRPHGKASGTPHQSVDHHRALATSAASYHDLGSWQEHASKVSEIKPEPGITASQHAPPNDEWPSVVAPNDEWTSVPPNDEWNSVVPPNDEWTSVPPNDEWNSVVPSNDEWPSDPPAASMSSVLEAPADTERYADPSNLPLDRTNQYLSSQLDEVEVTEDDAVDSLNSNHAGPASVSSRNIQEDNSGGAPLFDNELYKNMSTYQPDRHAFEHNEVEDGVSSVAGNLHQLSLQKDDLGETPEEDTPSVVIPNHLQVHTPECSQLSFGSFGPGISAVFPDPFASRPLKGNLEETSEPDVSSVRQSDNRNQDYYGDEHLRTTSDENLAHITGASAGNFDPPSASQPEVLKEENPEPAQSNQYDFPSAGPGYTFENTQQLNPAFAQTQTSSQMQNLAPFSSVMQAYSNSLPSTLLASTVQTVRESDLPYSPFMAQSMPTKYGNAASSLSGSTLSIAESLRAGSISTPQPTPQTHPGASVATGPALPQHLAVHPYSQPTLPLGHFANMIGYPLLPQSYTYMPSAFQQAFAGNSTYHQSLATLLPQYKNSVSASSLPQSATIAPGYGFGSSTTIPGNFPLNPPTAPAGTTMGYDDVISSQYKDNNHLMSLQQNENSAMWVHGPGSRTMSAVPASTYYSFQGQNQQPGGFRQGQQSQHFGALGYPNFYQSQGGISLEQLQQQQQQNARDGSLGGSQGQQSKQSQQLWQNGY